MKTKSQTCDFTPTHELVDALEEVMRDLGLRKVPRHSPEHDRAVATRCRQQHPIRSESTRSDIIAMSLQKACSNARSKHELKAQTCIQKMRAYVGKMQSLVCKTWASLPSEFHSCRAEGSPTVTFPRTSISSLFRCESSPEASGGGRMPHNIPISSAPPVAIVPPDG
jgi:hypothetical protein